VTQDEVDPFADVDRDGDLGSLVQELELVALLRRHVDGRGDLLPGHRRAVLRLSRALEKNGEMRLGLGQGDLEMEERLQERLVPLAEGGGRGQVRGRGMTRSKTEEAT
jgi:hypothetical protein